VQHPNELQGLGASRVPQQEELQSLGRNGSVKVSSLLLLLFYYFLHSSISSSCCEEDNDRCQCHLLNKMMTTPSSCHRHLLLLLCRCEKMTMSSCNARHPYVVGKTTMNNSLLIIIVLWSCYEGKTTTMLLSGSSFSLFLFLLQRR